MKVEAEIPDINIGDLGKEHTTLNSNRSFAQNFNFDLGFLKRDGEAFKKAFNNVFKDKPKFRPVETPKSPLKMAAKTAEEVGEIGAKNFGKIGNTLLHDLGEGNKMLGAGKLGAYAVGAMALVDFLNPFDDD